VSTSWSVRPSVRQAIRDAFVNRTNKCKPWTQRWPLGLVEEYQGKKKNLKEFEAWMSVVEDII